MAAPIARQLLLRKRPDGRVVADRQSILRDTKTNLPAYFKSEQVT